MGDVGRLFTGRKPALDAVRVLLTSSQQRVLVFTGVSGIGKSTLLARVAARADKDWHVRLLDAQVLVGGMVVRDEGSEQAALRLLRLVGSALADGAPWWRRGWTRRRAEAIGLPRRHRVRLSIRADRGGVITHSPVTVQAGTATQAEWRAAWVQDLLRVAGLLGRRRCLLLIDTCEWLTFFDDVHAELPRPDAPLGVGGWFADVLEQILERAPELRVVLAGTAVAEAWRRSSRRYVVQELKPWRVADVGLYLTRRGLPGAELAGPVTEYAQGVPLLAGWIADALTGVLGDPTTSISEDPVQAIGGIAELTRDGRRAWMRAHVLARVSGSNRRLLHAAAVLGTFTPQALETVASSPGPLATGHDWFDRLSGMSCLRELPDTDRQWQLHRTIRDWLLADLVEDDQLHVPGRRTLPPLHEAAAHYYEVLANGEFSVEAAHHRFALGQDTHATAWAQRLAGTLVTNPLDVLQLQLLTEAALSVPNLRRSVPGVFADAHLARAYLAITRSDHSAAHNHAAHGLDAYQEADSLLGIRTAALLAGQAAWHRRRYQDAATAWATAQQAIDLDDPAAFDLRCALAEAVFRTGDLVRADLLLSDVLDRSRCPTPPPSTPAQPETPGSGVCHNLPPLPLADGTPSRPRRGHLHLLIAQVAARRSQWNRAGYHARLASDHADNDPHTIALCHCLHAERAYYAWDLDLADSHINKGLAVARHCPDQRCMVLLQLSQADLANRRAEWGRPVRSTTSVSLSERTESAHQRDVAAAARTTARAFADELHDDHTLALTFLRDHADRALTLFRAAGDRYGTAEALREQANDILAKGNHARSRRTATEALALSRAIGDRHGQAEALRILAVAATHRGDFTGAKQHAADALALFRAVGDRHGQASVLTHLGDRALTQGDFAGAEQPADHALAIFRAIGDRYCQVRALRILGSVAELRHDFDQAIRHATEALALARAINNRSSQAHALSTLADATAEQGDFAGAEKYASEALTLFRANGDQSGQATVLRVLAESLLARGELTEAEKRGNDALAFHRATGNQSGQAASMRVLARIANSRGDFAGAKRRATEALNLSRVLGNQYGMAHSLVILAVAAQKQGRSAETHQLLSEAAGLFDAVGAAEAAAACRRRKLEL